MRKLITTLLMAIIVTTGFMLLPAQYAEASGSSAVAVPSSISITLYSSKDVTVTGAKKNVQYLCYVPKKATSLKTSKKSVVTLKQQNNVIYLVAKKAGTATVSFKCSGKTYKVKVTVEKYANPVSYVKIGSTQIAGSKFKATSNQTLKYSKFANKKVKVTIKLKSGWELAQYYLNGKMTSAYDYMKKGWVKSEGVKNGGSVKINGGKGFQINFMATNTGTGQQETFSIAFK